MTDRTHQASLDPMFSFDTASMGRITVDRFLGKHMLSLAKKLGDCKNTTATDLIDEFIAALARTEDGRCLAPEQIGLLSVAEKECFAERLLESLDYMYREHILEQSKDGNGETIVKHRYGDVTVRRESNETAAEYFRRAYMDHQDRRHKALERTLGPSLNLSESLKNLTGWARQPTLDALTSNRTISGALSRNLEAIRGAAAHVRFDTLGKVPSLSPFDSLAQSIGKEGSQGGTIIASTLPSIDLSHFRNPVLDTNDRLDGLIGRFDKLEEIAVQTVELVQSMNGAALGLLQSFAEGAKSTDRFARRSIWIAGMALLAAILMPLIPIGYDVLKSRQKNDDTRVIADEVVRQVADVQLRASDGIRDALAGQAERLHSDQVELTKAVAALSDVLRTLKAQVPTQAVGTSPVHAGN